MHLGCTGGASFFASWVGGDEINFQRGASIVSPASEPLEDMRHLIGRFADDRPLPDRARLVAKMIAGGQKRFEEVAANLCEGGRLLARRLHLPDEVGEALGQVTERWDGKGVPGEVAGEEIAQPLRIVRVAHDFVALAQDGGAEAAIKALRRRRGRGHDPQVVDAVLADPEALVRIADAPDAWDRVIDAEPAPAATVSSAAVEFIARAFGEFTDLKVGFLRGHSARVAELAATAAGALGCSRGEISQVRAAGFLHDLGRVAVANGIWEKPGSLTTGEWERVRLHPYYTERVLERSRALAPLALLAGSHHERLDGSGYHRGARAGQLDVGARLLAAADCYDAMTASRPYRGALSPAAARVELGQMVRAGTLEKRATDAVLDAAGEQRLDVRQGQAAVRYPELVRALVLLEPDASRELAPAAVAWAEPVTRRLRKVAANLGVDAVAQALVTEVAGEDAWASFPDEVRRTLSGNGSAILAELEGEWWLDADTAAIAAIEQPTLVVTAADSPPEFHQAPEALAKTIPNARLSQVGGGHIIDPAAPEVIGFVRQIVTDSLAA